MHVFAECASCCARDRWCWKIAPLATLYAGKRIVLKKDRPFNVTAFTQYRHAHYFAKWASRTLNVCERAIHSARCVGVTELINFSISTLWSLVKLIKCIQAFLERCAIQRNVFVSRAFHGEKYTNDLFVCFFRLCLYFHLIMWNFSSLFGNQQSQWRVSSEWM